MNEGFRLLPEQASTVAPQVDALYYFLLAVSGVVTLLIASLIVFFAIKYRRGSPASREVATAAHGTLALEVAWIVVPLVVSVVIFVWGAKLYFAMAVAPQDALQIDCVGRQWMWKFQHPQGNREINELHVPLGQPVAIRLISEDVIHALYVPAFRVKHDVLPSRYSQLWFTATKAGQFRLYCAEYCGAKHADMKGRVVVLEPSEYQAWLSGSSPAERPAAAGERLFGQMACGSCHRGGGAASRGPPLAGVFGSRVPLDGGRSAIADEDYLRESILRPAAKVVAGYEPIMPSFEGQIGEEALLSLVAYLKELGATSAIAPGGPTAQQPAATQPAANQTPRKQRPDGPAGAGEARP